MTAGGGVPLPHALGGCSVLGCCVGRGELSSLGAEAANFPFKLRRRRGRSVSAETLAGSPLRLRAALPVAAAAAASAEG